MIYGIGVDMLRIERGYDLWNRFGHRAAKRVLHPVEWVQLESSRHPGAVLARSFAVAEAFVKALGTGFNGVGAREVGATRAAGKSPRLVFSDRVERLMADRGIVAAHLSLTDEAGFVCAFVVLEAREKLDLPDYQDE